MTAPCAPWTSPDLVRACCSGLDDNYDLTPAIQFASSVLFRLSGRRFSGTCLRTLWPCFPAGTLITTTDGPRPIESIEVGTMVLTHRGRWRKVLDAGPTGHKPVVTMHGQGATLSATADHKVWASEVMFIDRRSKLGAPEWRSADKMVGHAWSTPVDVEGFDVPLPFGWESSGDDESFWWMVGRWIGDGWTAGDLNRPSQQAGRVFICCSHSEADELEARLGEGWLRQTQASTVRFSRSDRSLRSWLRRHFGVGAEGKQIPGWALGLQREHRLALLNGYASADGSTSVEGSKARVRTKASTVSRSLAVSVRMLAVSLGLPAIVTGPSPAKTSIIEGRVVQCKPLWQVSWLDGPSRMTWQDEGDGLLWGRVRRVSHDSPLAVPVYNLTVEEDHSFIANGIGVKNCRANNCSYHDLWYQPFTATPGWGYPSWPMRMGEGWSNCWGCGCGGGCNNETLDLPDYISSVVEVVVDGQVLPPSAYVIQDNRRLMRVDGGGWPCSNTHGAPTTFTDSVFTLDVGEPGPFTLTLTIGDNAMEIDLDSSSDGVSETQDALNSTLGVEAAEVVDEGDDVWSITIDTSLVGSVPELASAGAPLTIEQAGTAPVEGAWYVTYYAGVEPPPDAVFAASLFACQIALARCGGEGCVLPARLKDLSREGVEMAFADPLEFLDKGEVGIYEVDLWLKTVNPHRLQRRPGVYRADAGRGPRSYR